MKENCVKWRRNFWKNENEKKRNMKGEILIKKKRKNKSSIQRNKIRLTFERSECLGNVFLQKERISAASSSIP